MKQEKPKTDKMLSNIKVTQQQYEALQKGGIDEDGHALSVGALQKQLLLIFINSGVVFDQRNGINNYEFKEKAR